MKRILKEIDKNKWYHLETLKKYYKQEPIIKRPNPEELNKATIYYFIIGPWSTPFVEHPKTKRLRYATRILIGSLGLHL